MYEFSNEIENSQVNICLGITGRLNLCYYLHMYRTNIIITNKANMIVF